MKRSVITMALLTRLIVFVSCLAIALAEQESRYSQIIKLLNNNNQALKPEAGTYTSSVANPSSYSRTTARYSKPAADKEDDEKKPEEEEEEKPDRLALLLTESKFSCESLKNGYYADESVGCQVFHYCVDGVKHSWQCPENTVFHQIHLNCVPNTQDICQQSSKFHVVNDYLHKELDERGPNNTVLYHQRFYPEGFDVSGGDTVTQIFQAQALARLQKQRENAATRDEDYDEEQPVARPRSSRPKQHGYSQPPTQSARAQVVSKPSYKPANRPVIIPPGYSSQPQPTKRPVSYTTPESFSLPTYTESSQDDYPNSNDYSSDSSSSSSSSSSQGYSPSNLGSNYQSGSVSGFSSPSSSSYSPSSQGSYRSQGSSRPSNYPTRSLGIPIASFRVAPSSQSSYSPPAAQASTIHEVNVPPIMSIATAFDNNQHQPPSGYYF